MIYVEGFLFELERRGYLTAGEFVPEVALEHPDALRALHVDFQRAGSDIVEAFTYNGHREKMRVIGKEDLLEPLNRAALQIAREVADGHPGDLMAGNISNTNVWDPTDRAKQAEVRGMFEEMVGWAAESGADADSSVVVPRRCPSSISARVTHERSVSVLIPSCSPICLHALDLDAGSLRASTVSRVADPATRSGTSSVPPSSMPSRGFDVSIKPGT